MGSKARQLLSVAAPILGTLLAPGIGTALGSTLGASTLGAIGGGLGGAAGGALSGGGLKSALKGGALGAAGGYLGSGGASELLGGTALGNTLGLGAPEGGSVFGNILGSDAASPSSLGSLLSGSGLSPSSVPSGQVPSANPGFSAAENSFLAKAGSSPAERSLLSNAGLASPTFTASGGGASSFGGITPMNGLATILGGANSYSANERAQKDLLAAQKAAMEQLAPYQASGVGANTKLSDLLGTSGNSSAEGYGTLGADFAPGDLTKDPGYQFQLDQGTQALDRKNAASGSYFSGPALKAAQDYGQGLADTTYNNAYQRYLQQQQQQYGMLAGQAGQGANVAGAAANIAENTGNAKANAGISSSNILNSTLSSLLSGNGAKSIIGYNPKTGQPIYV